jgi:hypothetical protein
LALEGKEAHGAWVQHFLQGMEWSKDQLLKKNCTFCLGHFLFAFAICFVDVGNHGKHGINSHLALVIRTLRK